MTATIRKDRGSGASRPGTLIDRLRRAVGFGPGALLPSGWSDHVVREHIRKWTDEHRLNANEIVQTAAILGRQRRIPPEGPHSLDSAMERRARAKEELAAKRGRRVRRVRRKRATEPQHDEAEVLQTWAEWINSDRWLAPGSISNALARKLMNAGLVTQERMRQRQLGDQQNGGVA